MAPPFFTSALDGCEWLASNPGRFTLGTHWIRGWVGPRAGRNTVKRDRKRLALAGNRTPAVQPVAIPTELSRLPYYKKTNVEQT
jgi:hypothetical protein